MGKVVTSKGIQDFVQNGTVEHVQNHKETKSKEAPALEVKKDHAVDLGDKKAEPKEEAKEPENDDKDVPVLSEDSRKYVNKQHRLRKEAQEAAEDAERFAKDQYNRAMLAEQRAEQLAKELESNRQNVQKPKEPELKAPEAKDFLAADGQVDWDKYTDAKADYRAELKIREERKRIQDERADADRQEHIKRIQQGAEKVRKEFPDFDRVMENVKDTEADIVPQFVLNYVYESDNSALVAYHLAKNPEESQRIAKLAPIRGLAELGKLEERLTAKKAETAKEPEVKPERTGAPPPITPISSTSAGTVNTDPSKMSFAELRAYERERRKKR